MIICSICTSTDQIVTVLQNIKKENSVSIDCNLDLDSESEHEFWPTCKFLKIF